MKGTHTCSIPAAVAAGGVQLVLGKLALPGILTFHPKLSISLSVTEESWHCALGNLLKKHRKTPLNAQQNRKEEAEEKDRHKRRLGITDFSKHFKRVKSVVVDADVELSSQCKLPVPRAGQSCVSWGLCLPSSTMGHKEQQCTLMRTETSGN